MEEQSTNPVVVPSPKPQDYYVTRSKKVVDFIIGFATPLIMVMVGGTIAGATDIFVQSPIIIAILPILFIILYIAEIIYFFKKRRRFAAIGMLMVALIPMLLFGGCLLIMGIATIPGFLINN